MLSAILKLAMTHRSISSLDFGSVAVWGEGLLSHARHVEQTQRDDKSATPCEHGSIGKTKADDALPWVHREKQGGRRVWHQIGGERPPAKPCPLSLGATRESGNNAGGVRQSFIRYCPPCASNRHVLSPNRMARKWPTAYCVG